jgi:hypothetical protein
MSPEALLSAVQAHHGIFLCERIHKPRITKQAPFRHLLTAPQPDVEVPALGRLDDVYKAFGSITFYHHEASGDAARYLAAPAEWPALADALADWLEMLDEDELESILPHGLEGCVVIGETPASGNYILVPKVGPNAGKVIEFDHDGCEFTVVADDVVDYVIGMLTPDSRRLTDFASHMRFIEGAPGEQWWIRECRDSAGRRVTTMD